MVLIEDILEVPRDCVVDSVIPKKDIFEAADSKTKDKKIFTDLIKQIKWCYNFTEDNIRVDKYIDENVAPILNKIAGLVFYPINFFGSKVPIIIFWILFAGIFFTIYFLEEMFFHIWIIYFCFCIFWSIFQYF